MNSIFRFTLNMHNHRSQASISCFHGDTAIRLIITLVDGVNPFVIKEGCVAILSGTKADGKKLWDRCIIVGNTIQYDFHEQTASCKGVTNCEVTLYDTDGKAITAPKFTIVVDEREVTSADLYSTDHIDAISINRLVAMYDAEEARVTAEGGRIEAEESRATAEANRAEAEEARVAAEEARRLAEEERNKYVGKSAYEYAKEGGYTGTEEDFMAKMAKEMPTKISELANDKNFISASGAPVQSVNGNTGEIALNASDVGARPNTWTPTYSEVGADKSGAASEAVSEHNVDDEAHNDIRLELKAMAERINAVLDSDDTTLDELSEIVAYIKSNKSLIEFVTSTKVGYGDIVDNLTTNSTKNVLSATQGVILKRLIDALSNDKLDASALPTAIDTALVQAKESGEFDGADGERGNGILNITTAPSSYTTTTGGFTPAYRMALSTVISQSKVSKVLVGDTLAYSYYHYPVGYVDASYVYLATIKNIRGATGAAVTITSVNESDESGGSNTVIFSDGNTLTVKNGKDGKTPVKGVDYDTAADREAIVNSVIAQLPKYSGEVV